MEQLVILFSLHYFPLDGVLAGRLFAAFDKDKNGHIDCDEFLGELKPYIEAVVISNSSKLSIKRTKPQSLAYRGCLQAWFLLQTGLNLLWISVSFSEEYCFQ